MLNAVPLKDLHAAVVAPDRYADDERALGVPQVAPQALVEAQAAGRVVEKGQRRVKNGAVALRPQCAQSSHVSVSLLPVEDDRAWLCCPHTTRLPAGGQECGHAALSAIRPPWCTSCHRPCNAPASPWGCSARCPRQS